MDTVLFMVPADEPRARVMIRIIERLKAAKVPVIFGNKIDKVHPDQLQRKLDDFRQQMDFKEIVPFRSAGQQCFASDWHFSENLEEGFQSISWWRSRSFNLIQSASWFQKWFVRRFYTWLVKRFPHQSQWLAGVTSETRRRTRYISGATIMVERDSQKALSSVCWAFGCLQ